MNIPNNYTKFKSELYKSAIVIDLKTRVIEHRILAITETIEEASQLNNMMVEIHDLILIKEQSAPKRKPGSCHFPIVMHLN